MSEMNVLFTPHSMREWDCSALGRQRVQHTCSASAKPCANRLPVEIIKTFGPSAFTGMRVDCFGKTTDGANYRQNTKAQNLDRELRING